MVTLWKSPPLRDRKFLAFVRTKPCMFCLRDNIPIEAHHQGRRGMSQKADDLRAVPACHACHMLAQQYKYEALNIESMSALMRAIAEKQVDLLVEWFGRLGNLIAKQPA